MVQKKSCGLHFFFFFFPLAFGQKKSPLSPVPAVERYELYRLDPPLFSVLIALRTLLLEADPILALFSLALRQNPLVKKRLAKRPVERATLLRGALPSRPRCLS